MATPGDLYAPPDSQLSETAAPLHPDDLRAFVGPNAQRYLEQWDEIRLGRSILAGFNWSGFFATLFWMVHRRMYLELFAWLGVMIVLGLVQAGLASVLDWSEEAVEWIDSLSSLVTSIAFGFAANPLYFWKARRALRGVRSGDPTDPARREAIARLGGTNPTGVWLVVGAFVALIVAVFYLASIA